MWNRPRFGELNDRRRTGSYVRALRSVSDCYRKQMPLLIKGKDGHRPAAFALGSQGGQRVSQHQRRESASCVRAHARIQKGSFQKSLRAQAH